MENSASVSEALMLNRFGAQFGSMWQFFLIEFILGN